MPICSVHCLSPRPRAVHFHGDISQPLRRPFHLIIDEFQNFLSDNFEEILSEARKYGLSLILAHQNLVQIEKRMRESIFANTNINLFFHLGHNDIQEIAGEFKNADQELVKQTIITLEVGEAVQKGADGTFRKVKIHHIAPIFPDQ
jgi:DNA helicase HerA-like ATPase